MTLYSMPAAKVSNLKCYMHSNVAEHISVIVSAKSRTTIWFGPEKLVEKLMMDHLLIGGCIRQDVLVGYIIEAW